jgi:hypothetical protein
VPTYNFRNKKTGEITEEFMSISAREAFLKKNKNLEPYMESAPAFSYSSAGFRNVTDRTDNGFKEVLSKIADKHPASPLADSYGKRTIKETKTKNILANHRKKMKTLASKN